MIYKSTSIIVFVILLFESFNSKSQILFDMGDYRNIAYTSIGYNGAFENATIGIARRDYVKILKREIIGILDVSLPLTNHFFTRHSIRKGFQLDLYKKNYFRIPFMFASSSIVRENHLYKYHDITAEFSLAPGIYTNKYSFALDIKYEIIVFRYKKYRADYLNEINSKAKNHWEEPYYSIAKLGFMAGLNLKHFVIYVKTGYERNPIITNNYIPGYVLIGFGYKFQNKPLPFK